MTESLPQQKKKMHDVLEQMKKRYGVTRLIHKDADIALMLYLVLREGWDFKKATRAVKKLQEEFVDWNEVRVSFDRELAEVLAPLTQKDLDAKVKRCKDVLKAIFDKYNRVNLDFMRTQDFETARRALSEMEALGRANAHILVQCYQDELDQAPARSSKTLVMSHDGLRVAIRLGLIKKTSSLNVGRKELEKLLEPTRYIDFQNLFVRHAEQVCTSKNPACEGCFLNSGCAFYKA